MDMHNIGDNVHLAAASLMCVCVCGIVGQKLVALLCIQYTWDMEVFGCWVMRAHVCMLLWQPEANKHRS